MKFIFFVFLLVSTHVVADGLADLKTALTRLQGQQPIQAELISTFADTHDEQLVEGKVQALLTANQTGFHLTYPITELAKIEEERVAKLKNENITSPTFDAAQKLNAIDLTKMLSSSDNLARFIEQAIFLKEEITELQGQRVRLLTFDLAMETLMTNKKTRKYVDDFSASYQIWIANDGTPLESKLSYEGSGSAYLVLSIEAYGSNTEYYQVRNNRLLLVKAESTRGSKSFFGDFERKEQKTLTLMPNSENIFSTLM